MSDPTHFVVFPVKNQEICKPGEHDGWAINGAREGMGDIYAGTIGPDRAVHVVLHDLSKVYPSTDGRVSVRWMDPNGGLQETEVGSPYEVMDELMETVCDETPDDAENTDEHPLEEARSFLLDLHELREDSPEP
jgi:hypothetical protein